MKKLLNFIFKKVKKQELNLSDIEEIKHYRSNLGNGQMIVLQTLFGQSGNKSFFIKYSDDIYNIFKNNPFIQVELFFVQCQKQGKNIPMCIYILTLSDSEEQYHVVHETIFNLAHDGMRKDIIDVLSQNSRNFVISNNYDSVMISVDNTIFLDDRTSINLIKELSSDENINPSLHEEAMESIYKIGSEKELRDFFRENSTSQGINMFTLNLDET